tara:strand:- start:157 stop:504 length:348 start_codon:yes stop_codon:yes gene_type:complete
MPTERRSITLAANTLNNNILSGSIYEFMSRPTRVIVATACDQADVGIGVNFGSRTMAQQATTVSPLEPAAGTGPDLPQQVLVDDIALPGERIVVSVQGGAAASVTRVLTQFTEVG